MGGAELTGELMASLGREGKYRAPDELMERIRSVFSGYSLDEAGTLSVIGETWKKEHYLIDPHTAVGLGAVKQYRAETGDAAPVILASTASPFKFAGPVSEALGIHMDSSGGLYDGLRALSSATGWAVPVPLAETETLPVRFERVIDPAGMAGIPFEH
jgi:threonine synthase